MDASLLVTKLHVPAVRHEWVARPILVSRLHQVLHCKLALISAPAGFGKTTLISHWIYDLRLMLDGRQTDASDTRAITHRPSPIANRVAWLSLDEGDNDPVRFFSYLLAALQTVEPSIGQTAASMLQGPDLPPPRPLLTSLINDLAAISHPLILVLDDYHLISTLLIHEQLAFFVEHQPDHVHLVLITREDPPLSLARLRARGQMVDIRQADLRFTSQETAEFLHRMMGLSLAPADVEVLHDRTEGWIGGLQLAALSLQGSTDAAAFVRDFAGSHAYVLDYLMEEVFQRQPHDMRTFLLETSILDRFTAPLCDAVTGRDDSGQVLHALEQANTFLVPLDAQREWYRYHRLFSDLLRHRLSIQHDMDSGQIHRRAARWYQAHGFVSEAVQHALSAADWSLAAELVPQVAGQLMHRGEVATLLRWYRTVPRDVVHSNPQLCLEFTWPLVVTEQIDEAEACLDQVEQAAEERADPALQGAAAVARAHIARARGDHAAVMRLSTEALRLLPPDAFLWRCVVAMNVGVARWYQGDLAAAEEALREAREAAARTGNLYIHVAAHIFLARIHLARGKLHEADAAYRRLPPEGERVSLVVLAHSDRAKIAYEWNDLSAALAHARRGVEIAERSHSPEQLATAYGTLALVLQALGDRDKAAGALRTAEKHVNQPGTSPAAHLLNLTLRIHVALGCGDLAAAALAVDHVPGVLGSAPEAATSMNEYLFLMLAQTRFLLACGELAAAAAHVQALHDRARHAGWHSVVLHARALQALAAPTPEQALAAVAEAVTLAEPEGYVRTFVDCGEPMAGLLRRAIATGAAGEYATRLLAAFPVQSSGRDLEPARALHLAVPIPAAQPLAEPPSEREIEVLVLLCAGYTNQEIARNLYISVNTVKTHLRSIYGKLGVNDRRAAATMARRLSLIPEDIDNKLRRR
ncbi:MAG: hypothetical protein JXA93_23670 [Anaerolineae bacterium]|nr:hypothetical protein [Anaerolineae bacterium]